MTIDRTSLDPGERLLWEGRPDRAAYRAWRDPVGFAGLYPLTGGMVVALIQYLTDYASALNALAALLIVIGIALLLVPFRVWREARNAAYAVTDRRAIIERPGLLLRNRISVPLADIRRVDVGAGAAIGTAADVMFRDYTSESEHGTEFGRDGFIAVRDASRIGAMLRAAVEKATGKPL
jgi:hypothetical protein